MPQQNDDDTNVPPIKILRRRRSGVYRSDGLSGPTRRYALIVAILIGLASLPTLVVITAGSTELDKDATGPMDVPLLPPVAGGPVVPPTATTSPPSGKAQKQQSKPRQGYDRKPSRPGPYTARKSESRRSESRRSESRRSESRKSQSRTSQPRTSRPQEAAHRRDSDRPARQRKPVCRSWAATERDRLRQVIRSLISRRSKNRHASTRESAVSERLPNIRTARAPKRTHNSRRHRAESRPDNARWSHHSRHNHRSDAGRHHDGAR